MNDERGRLFDKNSSLLGVANIVSLYFFEKKIYILVQSYTKNMRLERKKKEERKKEKRKKNKYFFLRIPLANQMLIQIIVHLKNTHFSWENITSCLHFMKSMTIMLLLFEITHYSLFCGQSRRHGAWLLKHRDCTFAQE